MEGLKLAYINFKGQTGMVKQKLIQLETLIKAQRLDIINLQEVWVDSKIFLECPLINGNYQILTNNSRNNYGTSTLVSRNLKVDNVKIDSDGRVLIFDLPEFNLTIGNTYLQCGSDSKSKRHRDKTLCETVPELLANR